MASIIFDFDGTLANSLPILIDIANTLGVSDRTLTVEDYKQVRNMPIRDIIRMYHVPIRRIPGIVKKGRMAIKERINEVELMDGVDDLLRMISANNRLFVVSTNSKQNVESFLERYKVADCFEAVHGDVSVFGKASVLRKVIKKHGLDKSQTIYVGDEIRDIEAAKKAGVTSIAVTWGYNGEQILTSRKPNFIAHKPSDIQAFIKEKNK